MHVKHLGKSPAVHPGARVASNAVPCGDVSVGAGCRIQYGAQVIAESGSIMPGPP